MTKKTIIIVILTALTLLAALFVYVRYATDFTQPFIRSFINASLSMLIMVALAIDGGKQYAEAKYKNAMGKAFAAGFFFYQLFLSLMDIFI